MRIPARYILHFRDMGVSPRTFCRDAMRALCEARKIDIGIPHPDEIAGHDGSGKPFTYREYWAQPESYDQETGLPVYPEGSPLAPAALEAIAKEKAELDARLAKANGGAQ
jgi:hypothetical protein